MKIAIPVDKDRISPRFIYTDRILISEYENGEITGRKIIDAGEPDPIKRVQSLVNMGIDILICCGIERFTAIQVDYHGIKVYHRVNGNVNDVLWMFHNNELEPFIIDFYKTNKCVQQGHGRGMIRRCNRRFSGKEGDNMPGKDRTGPQGIGPGTGRGMGSCNGGGKIGRGGQGGGRGMGRGNRQGAGGGRGAGRDPGTGKGQNKNRNDGNS